MATLKLPRVNLLKRQPKTPHRKRVLASCVVNGIEVELATNYPRNLFFVVSRGGGLRWSDPLVTRNAATAETWRKAIQRCDVEIPDPLG